MCTVLCYIPQVIKSWRTRSVRDLSWGMLLLLFLGAALWLAYAILKSDVPIIAVNVAILALSSMLLYLKATAWTGS
jgi:MtN3 and saliva related transmembrane protein